MLSGMAAQFGVRAHASATPDKVAVVDGDRRLTYADLDVRSRRLASALEAHGVEPGDRVAVMLPNCLELVESLAASAAAEAQFVPVNWHLKGDELAYVLRDSGAKVLIAAAPLLDHVGAALAGVEGCALLVVGGDMHDYEQAIDAASPTARNGLTTPAWMFYTSGTTGRPKGVIHGRPDDAAMTMAQQMLMALWGFTPDDVHLLSGPGYHAGPGGYVASTLFVGGTVVVLPEWDARAWLRLVSDERVTTTFMTPAHFIRLLEVPEAERAAYDLSSLRLVIHAGAPCPVEVKSQILDALPGAEVSELYGASEGGITRITAAEWRAHPGSVGQPWPGVEVRILGPDLGALPAGEDGVIYVRPAGGRRFHYHDDEAKTASVWVDDAFTVGDIGHVDDQGWLYITDRESDMVLWGGVNIYPREIEEVLHQHPAVVDCAVLGIPDERDGERLKAVVEVRTPVDTDELVEFCRARLADFKVPREVALVDTLPRDPNGKVLKRLLRPPP
jgi:long-chain acyl-CoA synthetase